MAGLIGHFLAQVQARADRPAVIFRDQVVTYRQMVQQVASVQAQLQAAGIRRGDRCVVQLPNGITFAVLLLAASAMGITLAPVATSLQAPGVRQALQRCQTRWWLTYPQQQLAVPESLRVDLTLSAAECSFAQAQTRLQAQADEVDEQAPFILTLTSGSTGAPKPITLSQAVKWQRINLGAMQAYGLQPGERVLVASPMYHSLALRLTLLPLVTGGTAVILPHFSTQAWLAAVSKHQVTFTLAVSVHLARLAPLLQAHQEAVRTMHTLVSSSAPLDGAVRDQWLRWFPGALHECYGTSETGIATNIRLDTLSAEAAVGQVGWPLPQVKVKIVNDKGDAVPPGEIGQIALQTPMIFAGYYGLPEETAAAFDAQGYFLTGDLGRLDAQGCLYYVGRCKEVIMVGGINVYPQDIESVLQAYPGVREVAVVGQPDERWGEQVVAYLVAEDGKRLDEWSLRSWCMQQLADFQQPRRFIFLAALPRNALGKVDRRRLQAEEV